MNAQYTLGSQLRKHRRLERSADGRQQRPQTIADFDYDIGYNNFDVRHTFNVSALYSIPTAVAAKPGTGVAECSAAGTSARSSTRAAACRSTSGSRVRTWSTSDAAGNVFDNPRGLAARRSSTRRTAATRATSRRPDLVPGVNPFIEDGGLLFLNPAAFATPTARHLRQSRARLDSRAVASAGRPHAVEAHPARRRRNVEFRSEIFNLFNRDNSPTPRHAAQRPAEQRADRGEQGAAGAGRTPPPLPAPSGRSQARSVERSGSAPAARSSSRCVSTSDTAGWQGRAKRPCLAYAMVGCRLPKPVACSNA